MNNAETNKKRSKKGIQKIKLIISILLTICIVGTLLYIAIFNKSETNLQDTSGLTQIVGHTHDTK